MAMARKRGDVSIWSGAERRPAKLSLSVKRPWVDRPAQQPKAILQTKEVLHQAALGKRYAPCLKVGTSTPSPINATTSVKVRRCPAAAAYQTWDPQRHHDQMREGVRCTIYGASLRRQGLPVMHSDRFAGEQPASYLPILRGKSEFFDLKAKHSLCASRERPV